MDVTKKDFYKFVRTVCAVAVCVSFLSCEETKDESPMRKYAKMYGAVPSEPAQKPAVDSSKFLKQGSAAVAAIPSSSSVSFSSSFLNKVVVESSSEVEKLVDSVVPEEKADLCANAPEGLLCDKRDGKLYGIVRFGSQFWMSKNLNYDVPDSWCYNNQSVYCKEYGRLYKWSAALGLPDSFTVLSAADSLKTIRQGVCPEGWHIPSNDEMKAFYNFARQRLKVKPDSLIEGVGTSLKNKTGWEESSDAAEGTDRFGFSAKPSGYRTSSGTFNYLGQDCNFWVASESAEPDRAPYWNLYFDNDDFLGVYTNLKSSAYSVRCIKD